MNVIAVAVAFKHELVPQKARHRKAGMRRVAVTGMGVVSPVGNDVETFWHSLTNGVSGIDEIHRFDASRLHVSVDAEVKGFDPKPYYASVKEMRKTDLSMQYAMAAATQAVTESGIMDSALDHERFGVYIGSGIGGLTTLYEEAKHLVQNGPDFVSPFLIPKMISNMASGAVSIRFDARGCTLPVVTACATGTDAIGEAFHAIRDGYADAIIAGGTEATITELAFAGFQNLKALSLSENKDAASLPFDNRRAGFVMGEGAGVLVLEEYEAAKVRGAHIYAELAGYGNTSDAHHITAPDPTGTGAARCIRIAMQEAGLKPDQPIYVNAHGTGTRLNDAMETKALKQIFGTSCDTLHVSSTKSMTGHMLGAAGGVEAIAAVKALQTGIVPPTLHLDEKDPECDLDYTPNEAIKADLAAAASTSFGFGGHDGCIVFRKAEEVQA